MINNKVLVNLTVEDGCSENDGEVRVEWSPINFNIYSDLFQIMVDDAVENWLSDNKVGDNLVELIMGHVRVNDGSGALLEEYFEVLICQKVKL